MTTTETATRAMEALCRFELDRAEFLRQYETVFLRPIRDGFDAVPIGNGDLTALLWQPDYLTFMVNKCDISGCASQAARLVIETPRPLADRAGRLETRLSLAEACTTVTYAGGEKPIGCWRGDYAPSPQPGPEDQGNVKVTAFVPEGRNALLVEYEETADTDRSVQVVLERWFQPSWGTTARADVRGSTLVIEYEPQEATSCRKFAVVLAFAGFEGARPVQLDTLRLALQAPAGRRIAGRLAVAVVTDLEATDPAEAAAQLAAELLAEDADGLRRGQRDYWLNQFWGRFFVEAGHPYANALYLMALYELGITSRGRAPVKFNGALNLWSENERSWGEGYTLHNQHSTHMPVYTANQVRLADNFHEWIIAIHPEALKAARKYLGVTGAYYPEYMSQHFRVPEPDVPWGRDPKEWYYLAYILSSGTRLASLLWSRYEYTLDREFLRRAYPVLRDVAEFYVHYGKLGPDGRYHVSPSQCWEEPPVGRDAQADCAAWRMIFHMAIRAAGQLGVDAEKVAVWRERLDRAPEYPVWDGLFSVVVRDDGTPEPVNHFQWMVPNLSGVYPYEVIGLDSPPELLQRARATFDRLRYNADAGHEYLPVIAARLGDADAWRAALFNFVQFFQTFDQGLFSYYSTVGNKCEEYAANREQLQWYLDGSGIYATAVSEMLLQSHGGVIRVFPAAPAHWHSRFILLARGAFLVASEHRGKEGVPYILIQAVGGEPRPCRVALPWDGGATVICQGRPVPVTLDAGVLKFACPPERVVAITPAGRTLDEVPVVDVGFSSAWSPSRLGMTWYGLKEGANNHTATFPLW